MVLKPQDVLVVLQISTLKGRSMGFVELSQTLAMSLGAVHASHQRAKAAGLLVTNGDKTRVATSFVDFAAHGVPVVFFAERGEIGRGIPTSIFAPALERQSLCEPSDVPIVWPHPEGKVRGETLKPLYKTVPEAANGNRELYDLLALLDVMRVGRPKDKKIAAEALTRRIFFG